MRLVPTLWCFVLLFLGQVGYAGPIFLSIENFPTQYTPNSSFTFDVKLTGGRISTPISSTCFSRQTAAPRASISFSMTP